MSEDCAFCRIADDPSDVVVLHAEAELLVILDHMPIRPGHCMILSRAHYPYFDDLPQTLAQRSMVLAQDIARAMKTVYGVERVAFFATGSDIAHAHLHLVPMHDKTDLTSARYMTGPPRFRRLEITAHETLAEEADRLRARLEVFE